MIENPNAPPMYPMHNLPTARRSLLAAYQRRCFKVISEGTFQAVSKRLEARIAELEKEERPKKIAAPCRNGFGGEWDVNKARRVSLAARTVGHSVAYLSPNN